MAKQSRLTSYGFMLVNTVVWAAAFIIVKPAFEVTTPFRFLFYRYFLAVLASAPFILYYLHQRYRITWQMLFTVGWIELIGTGLALALVYWGLNYTTAIEANLLTSSLPIFIIFGGIWLLKEKQEGHELKGLIIAATGTLVLTLIPVITGEQNTILRLSLLGNLLILAHNLANAVYFPMAKKHYAKFPKLLVSSISFYIGLLVFGLLSLLEAGSVAALISTAQLDLSYNSVVWAAAYMALFGSIIGYTAYIKGQNGIEASEAALFWYLQPLIYLPLGVIILGEQLTIWHIIGLVLTTTGVYVAEKRISKQRKARVPTSRSDS